MSVSALDRVGNMVLALGSPGFGREYYQLFRDALDIEACTVFAFRPDAAPTPLVAECDSRDRREQAWQLANDYSNGSFRHDPIIRARLRHASRAASPLVYRLRAEQVRDAGYRRHFYDEPALHQKIGILGSIDGTVYYSNFYRGPVSRFANTSRELVLLRELAVLAVKALRRHHVTTAWWADADQDQGAGEWHPRALSHLQRILRTGPHGLSAREAEVCAHIVLGYSALAIGLRLDVSVNTVATHRKRAYRKLGVCSQNELFERYFAAVTTLGCHPPR